MNKFSFIVLLLIVIIGIVVGFNVVSQNKTDIVQENIVQQEEVQKRVYKKKVKPDAIEAKGLYLTAYSASSEKKRQQIIDLINNTELNTVVIDIKDYSGKILYDSNLLLVSEFGTKENRLGNVKEIIKHFHDNDIYVIARQTVFQDPILAQKKPEWAIKTSGGGIWRDFKGLAWVDPTQQAVWRYNIAIAKEAVRLGFDEINFDYVRFPTDGNTAIARYAEDVTKKYKNMSSFYEFVSRSLEHEPVWTSADLFGFVMEREGESDLALNIGQRLEDTVDTFDYICPMMYPSHYPSGHLGIANPAAHPGPVIKNGMEMGQPKFEGHRAQSRPWIQAFNIGAVYDATKIRAQIDQVEAFTDGGWLLWNAANRYSAAGLKLATSTNE